MVPARKIRSACLRFLPAPLGPGWSKFAAGAVFGLRLSMLSQRSRSQTFPQGGRTIPPIRGKCPEGTKWVGGHGEAVTDEDALLDRNPYSNGRRVRTPPLRRKPRRGRWFGRVRRGCGAAAATIFASPGLSGPDGTAESRSDFARRKFCSTSQVRVPRNGGSRGRAAWRQERRSRFCRLRPPPGGSLVTFWPSRKSLAAGAAKLPLRKKSIFPRQLQGKLP